MAYAADLKASIDQPEVTPSEKTRPPSDPRTPERPPLDTSAGHSRGNGDPVADLERAIANVTRALATTDADETVRELVAERRAMRAELHALRHPDAPTNVTDLAAERRRRARES
jgi:hypothetical protein